MIESSGRKSSFFEIRDWPHFFTQLVHWLGKQDHFSLLNGNDFSYPDGPFRTFAAAGAMASISTYTGEPFMELQSFFDRRKDWLIGRLNYDLKKYPDHSINLKQDPVRAPDMYFFVPETLIFKDKHGISIQSFRDPERVIEEILQVKFTTKDPLVRNLLSDTTQQTYLKNAARIREQILDGDFYELNYCIAFSSMDIRIDPGQVYLDLNKISPMPFSVFQGTGDHLLLSASPERFLKKTGSRLLTQPIKGTSRRDPDPDMDHLLKKRLQHSDKERAENMMIVDLMRNDLAKSAVTGTVRVEELFGIYTFSHVHQMISTISAELDADTALTQAIHHAFPMGSMTGAPKIRAMQEIDRYEHTARGMFSGAAGYITPEGDFDFNVLIRSIFYNRTSQHLKFHAGSAITSDADPLQEYHECLLKTEAIREALHVHPS